MHFRFKGAKTLLQKREKLCVALPLGKRGKHCGIERFAVTEADFPGAGYPHGRSHGLESACHEEGEDRHAHLQGEKRHASFEGLKLPVRRASSLGKDENPFALGEKSEKEFEDPRRALGVRLRDGDRSEMGKEPLENGSLEKLVPSHVGEPVGKSGAYDDGVEIAAMVAGEDERLLERNPVALFYLEPIVDDEDKTAEPFHQEIEHYGKPPDQENVFEEKRFFGGLTRFPDRAEMKKTVAQVGAGRIR